MACEPSAHVNYSKLHYIRICAHSFMNVWHFIGDINSFPISKWARNLHSCGRLWLFHNINVTWFGWKIENYKKNQTKPHVQPTTSIENIFTIQSKLFDVLFWCMCVCACVRTFHMHTHKITITYNLDCVCVFVSLYHIFCLRVNEMYENRKITIQPPTHIRQS